MKKKVLFALIALFSFVGAWAAHTGTKVTVSGYDVYLSEKFVALAGNPATASAPTINAIEFGGEEVTTFVVDENPYTYANGKVSPASSINAVGNYYLKVTITSPDGNTIFYVPFQVGAPLKTEVVWDEESYDESKQNGFLKLYLEDSPYSYVWDSQEEKCWYPGNATAEEKQAVLEALANPNGRYVYDWKAIYTDWGANQLFGDLPWVGFGTTSTEPFTVGIKWGGHEGKPADNDGNPLVFGSEALPQTFMNWKLTQLWNGEELAGRTPLELIAPTAQASGLIQNRCGASPGVVAANLNEALGLTGEQDGFIFAHPETADITFLMLPAETPAEVPSNAALTYNEEDVEITLARNIVLYKGTDTTGPDFTVTILGNEISQYTWDAATNTNVANYSAEVVKDNGQGGYETVYPGHFHSAKEGGDKINYYWRIYIPESQQTFISDPFIVNPAVLELTLTQVSKSYGEVDPAPSVSKDDRKLQNGDEFKTESNPFGNVVIEGMDEMKRYGKNEGEDIGTYQYTVDLSAIHIFVIDGEEVVAEPAAVDEPAAGQGDAAEPQTVPVRYEDYVASDQVVSVGVLDIVPRTTDNLVAFVDDVDFDGSKQYPAVVVYYAETLVDGKPTAASVAVPEEDYAVTYNNNAEANATPYADGTRTLAYDEDNNLVWRVFRFGPDSDNPTRAIITFNGNNYGKNAVLYAPFKIRQKNIAATHKEGAKDVADVTIVQNAFPTYDGTPKTDPGFTVTDNKQKNDDGTTRIAVLNEQKGGQVGDYIVAMAAEPNNINVTWDEEKDAQGNVTKEASKAHAIIQGNNQYYGEIAVDFDIEGADDFDVAVTFPEEGFVYDGTEKEATEIVVTVGEGEDKVILTEDVDYTVSYKDNVHASNSAPTVTITGIGNYSNASYEETFAIDQALLKVIAPQNLTKAFGEDDPESFEATIDTWKNNDDKLKWDDDEDETTPDVVKVPNQPSALANELAGMYTIVRAEGDDKGEYALTFKDKDNKAIDATKTYAFKTNGDYKIQFVEGKLTIGVRSLNIIADNATASFGDDLTSETFTSKLTYTVDENCFQNGDDISILEGYEFEVYVKDPASIKQGLNTKALRVKEVNNKIAPENYQFVFVDGSLSLGKKGITVTADDITEVYGQNKSFTYTVEGLVYPAFDPTDVDGYDEMTDEEKAAAEAEYIAGQELAFRTFLATAEGDYNGQPFVQEIPEGAEAASKDFSKTPYNIVANEDAPKAYLQDYTISYVGAKLTRTQREVDVTAKDQTGDNAIAYGEDIKKGENWYTIEEPNADNTRGLIPGDVFGTVTLSKKADATSIGMHPSAIYATVDLENPNYHINYLPGDLEIEAGDRIALHLNRPYLGTKYEANAEGVYEANGKLWDETKPGKLVSDRVYDENEGKDTKTAMDNFRFNNTIYVWNDDDERVEKQEPIAIPNTADQLLQDYDGQTAKIHFGDFNFYKDRWYTLVLPFDTKVSDISKAFGYAVIDVLDVTNTDKTTVSFKQYIHEIPANTPFLIKVPEDINMKDVVFFAHKEYEEVPVLDDGEPVVDEETGEPLTETKLVTKHGYEIQYASEDDMKAAAEEFDATAAAATASATNIPIAIKDLGGNMIIGTYLGKYGLEAGKETTIGNSGVSLLKKNNVASAYIYPFGAYFRVADATSAADLRLLIEEADGTVTAITAAELGNANEAGVAEGWYTITGIKLEGKPATKGTYIYNGKVVYVK